MPSIAYLALVLMAAATLCSFAWAAWLYFRDHPFLQRRRARRTLMERLGRRPGAAGEAQQQDAAGPRGTPLARLTEMLTRSRARTLIVQLERTLLEARIPLKAVEFLYITAAALLAALMTVQFVTDDPATMVGVSIVSGFAPFFYLRYSQQRRFLRLDMQVADALLLMSNSIRSGASFMDSMDAVAHEMAAPICDEFGRTIRDVSLGVPVDEAFTRMSTRCQSEDLDLAVTAFMVQRETGGSLSEMLDNIGATIRDRMKLKQEIRTLSAQGKLSGFILCSMPAAVAVILHSMNPEYLRPLLQTPDGKMLLFVSAVMQAVGILTISRVVKIDV